MQISYTYLLSLYHQNVETLKLVLGGFLVLLGGLLFLLISKALGDLLALRVVLLDPLPDRLGISATSEWLGFGGAGLDVEEGGETVPRDRVDRRVVGGSVHLGDADEVLKSFLADLLGHLLVFGGELLAVSAPWSIHFEEHILIGCEYLILKSFSDDHANGLVVGLGDLLRLEGGLDLARLDVAEERGDLRLSKLTSKDKLLLVAGLQVDSNSGELGNAKHVLNGGLEHDCVDVSEVV